MVGIPVYLTEKCIVNGKKEEFCKGVFGSKSREGVY